jgi:hypothetical protein
MEEHSLAEKEIYGGEEKQKNLSEKFWSVTISDQFLAQANIRQHEIILHPWFREGSLGYIFGLRGSGKTWFAWKMAISVSRGEDFGAWKCEKPRKTMYVDGEMTLKSMQDRLLLLNSDPSGNLHLLSHEKLADKENIILNLCREEQQDAILECCTTNGIRVVFLDNLSCLCFGMKENEADSWEKVLGWLLKFRRAGVAVVIVHHANREGNDMRGTSRREDAASWVIKISQPHEFYSGESGTFFTTTFTKNRDDYGQKEKSMDWLFFTKDGKTNVSCQETNTKTLVYDMIASGIESNKDIASSLGISAGRVSKITTQLHNDGLVQKHGSKYVLT